MAEWRYSLEPVCARYQVPAVRGMRVMMLLALAVLIVLSLTTGWPVPV